MKAIVFSFSLLFYFIPAFSQDTISNNKRAEVGAIFSLMGTRPLDMNIYNRDYNLTQSSINLEAGLFYRKYLSKSFDLQIEAMNGGRILDLTDSITSFRVNDIYYSLNILPVLKFRYDPEQYKVGFSMAVGPSVNFLGARKYSFLQNTPSSHQDLSFGDIITLAFASDMGIKYNYTQSSSFLIGIRGSTDFLFLNNKNDKLEVKYNNFGLYFGFAGKVRKR
jgi:hypothetical protein